MDDFSLVDAENKYYFNPVRFSSSKTAVHPSEASVEYYDNGFKVVEGKCMREAYYSALRLPKTDNLTSVHLMDTASVGKWDEQGVVERWKQMGIWVDNNIKFYNKDLVLSGELDCIIRNPLTGGYILQEIKSYYGYYAEKLILGGKQPPRCGQPKVQQYLQASIYNWEYLDRIEESRMYYIDRGNGKRCEFRIGCEEQDGKHVCWHEQIFSDSWNYYQPGRTYMPFTVEDIYARIKKLIEYIRKNELPPRDFGTPWPADKIEYFYSKGDLGKTKYEAWKKNPDKNPVDSYHCNYCFYRTKCNQDEMKCSLGE